MSYRRDKNIWKRSSYENIASVVAVKVPRGLEEVVEFVQSLTPGTVFSAHAQNDEDNLTTEQREEEVGK
ncbi:Hypothetical protein SMAX5B_015421 [Scophthalmus maximus]|uniref:Uncharacterized protein n=1 Tax=Scophthalmus maximus TaxID=52904 RepID=A0A2U9BZP7_SCOMX|nr:Hypothetical protein SMAX5B_015421 [Scophthalmus maximus]